MNVMNEKRKEVSAFLNVAKKLGKQPPHTLRSIYEGLCSEREIWISLKRRWINLSWLKLWLFEDGVIYVEELFERIDSRLQINIESILKEESKSKSGIQQLLIIENWRYRNKFVESVSDKQVCEHLVPLFSRDQLTKLFLWCLDPLCDPTETGKFNVENFVNRLKRLNCIYSNQKPISVEEACDWLRLAMFPNQPTTDQIDSMSKLYDPKTLATPSTNESGTWTSSVWGYITSFWK